MSYYWFSREELLKKAKDKYDSWRGKEKASEYYQRNKATIKKKARNKYKDLPQNQKKIKRLLPRIRYYKLKSKK